MLLFCIVVITGNACLAQEAVPKAEYTYKEGDSNGTGKWYMGREIAYVMGFQGINWLNRSTREKEENTETLIVNLDIRTRDTVADIGAGSGYHVFKMAPLAQQGRIYAVDIQDEMLEAIRKKRKYLGQDNIVVVKGGEKTVNLPENSVNKVLMVDVYHEFAHPIEMLASLKKALKPGGKIYLIEYRGEDAAVPIKKLHKMTEAQAVKEMVAAGFTLEQNKDNLPWQHCMVFVEKKE